MSDLRLLRNALLALLFSVLLVGCASTDTHDADAVAVDAPKERTPPTTVAPALVQKYQEQIDPDDLAAQVYYLSGDHFKGRDTGTPHLRQAATYLATQYQAHGVGPAGTMRADDPRAPERYFQPVELFGFDVTRAHLTARHGDMALHEATYAPDGADGSFFPVFGNQPERTGGVVFGGYGIADAALGYDDFAALAEADIDVEGQWLILLHGEPADADGTRLLTDDGAPSEWTGNLGQKLQRAFGSGPPAGVLIVGDVGPEPINMRARTEALASVNAPVQVSVREASLRQNVPPVFMINTDMADALLAPADRSVAEARSAIHEARAPHVFSLPDVTLESTLTHTPVEVTSPNVLGYIEGSDPDVKDELIVITSHYDHTGLSPAGPAGDYIYNGADDNASGTVGTLAMAAAFQAAAQDGVGPRRSILFMNVTAEERGLLGSAYYTDIAPVFPIEQTVLAINMDMIGRIDPSSPTLPDSNYVYIIGGDLISDDLHEANQQANALTGLNLTLSDRYNDPEDPQQLFRRSDQWNFGKYNIPFIFYFTGLHEDYHAVGDTADKIEYERMADIVRLAFATVWEVANQDDPPAVTGEGFN